jgi:predicted RecA/RadA family phage recombinase
VICTNQTFTQGVYTMPIYRDSNGDNVDYTPGSAVSAGDVAFQKLLCGVAPLDIAASTLGALAIEGVFKAPKITGAIAAGDTISWNATGDPVVGTAGTGAANTSGIGKPLGVAILAAASGDEFVYFKKTTPLLPNVQSVAAAGSVVGDATAITANGVHNVVTVTAGDGTKGVILPAAVAGQLFFLKNNAAAILKVYPPTGGAINALSANAAISMASLTSAIFMFTSATTVMTIPLLPS